MKVVVVKNGDLIIIILIHKISKLKGSKWYFSISIPFSPFLVFSGTLLYLFFFSFPWPSSCFLPYRPCTISPSSSFTRSSLCLHHYLIPFSFSGRVVAVPEVNSSNVAMVRRSEVHRRPFFPVVFEVEFGGDQ